MNAVAPSPVPAGAAVEGRERLVVGEEGECRAAEGAQQLRRRVGRHLAPGKAAQGGEGQGDGGVEVRSGNARRDVDPHGDGEPPGEVDGERHAGAAAAQRHLRHHPGSEHDQHQGPQELGRRLSRRSLQHRRIIGTPPARRRRLNSGGRLTTMAFHVGRSSNGRTHGSGPWNRGSNPCLPASSAAVLAGVLGPRRSRPSVHF